MVTRCQECGFDWGDSALRSAALINDIPRRLTRLLVDNGIGDTDTRLRRRPAADVWSPMEYIAHTGDAIAWYADRICRIMTERCPSFDARDWDAHTNSRNYHERRLDRVLAQLSHVCAGLVATVDTVKITDWCREGIGSDGQPRGIAELINRAAHEAQHHLHDVCVGLAITGSDQGPPRDGVT